MTSTPVDIRSSRLSLKFSNKEKLQEVSDLMDEYKRVMEQFIDLFWDMKKVPKFISKELRESIDSWFSARMTQCAGQQTSGVVRGARRKQEKRLYVINKLTKEGKFKQARKLQRIYDETKVSKPSLSEVSPELDSRFIKIDLDNKTSFDGWLTLTSIGSKKKLVLPFKRSKHFNKLLSQGTLKAGVRISRSVVTFMFEIPRPEMKQEGDILGIDIGLSSLVSCSNGFVSKKNLHGHDLSSITKTLSRKKRGSKGFKKAVSHRKNYVNWSVNQLNLDSVAQVNLEDIKHLRKNKSISRQFGHWTYREIFDKLEDYCSRQGVLVKKVNPTYTSQRCSSCGWVRKRNRRGKLFKCDQCGFTQDADLNASINISLPLKAISKEQRLSGINIKGFYWSLEGQAPIVPATQRTKHIL